MKEFKLVYIDFQSFSELWKTSLGSNRNEIQPIDSRQYLGVQDVTIIDTYTPIFLAIKNNEDSYSAIISGHATSSSTYRVRGLCIFDVSKEEQDICVKILFDVIEQEAKKQSCSMLWDLVNLSSLLFDYQFKLNEPFKDGMYFASKKICR